MGKPKYKYRLDMPEELREIYTYEEYNALDSKKRWVLRNPETHRKQRKDTRLKLLASNPTYDADRKRQKALKDVESFAYQKWASYIKSNYNISADEYWGMYNNQGGVCAMCGLPETVVRQGTIYGQRYTSCRLVVDHDHSCCPTAKSCGKCVRGLLCNHCNSILGNAKDSISTLQQGIRYLTNYLDRVK